MEHHVSCLANDILQRGHFVVNSFSLQGIHFVVPRWGTVPTQLHLCYTDLYGIIDSTISKTFFEMVRRLEASKLCLLTVCGRSRGMMELGARKSCEPGDQGKKKRFEDSRWRAAQVSCPKEPQCSPKKQGERGRIY